jgi:hypothetical protein
MYDYVRILPGQPYSGLLIADIWGPCSGPQITMKINILNIYPLTENQYFIYKKSIFLYNIIQYIDAQKINIKRLVPGLKNSIAIDFFAYFNIC